MADKITLSVDNNQQLKHLDTLLNESTKDYDKHYFKILGTSV